MKEDKIISDEFVVAVTAEVAKLIAVDEHISVDQARSEFKNSKVYNYLCDSSQPFYEEDPQDFFEMYENLKNKEVMLNNTDLYLKNHPELYSLSVD